MAHSGDEESVREAVALLNDLVRLNDDLREDGTPKHGAKARACRAAGLDGSNFTKWENMLSGELKMQNPEAVTLKALRAAVQRMKGGGSLSPAPGLGVTTAKAAVLYRDPGSPLRDVFRAEQLTDAEIGQICSELDEAATGQAITPALARVVTRWWRAAHPATTAETIERAKKKVAATQTSSGQLGELLNRGRRRR